MKISSATLMLIMALTAAVSVGCSSKDDPKVPASAAGGGGGNGGGAGGSGGDASIQGTWTSKSHFDSWQEFEAGTKDANQACSVFKEKSPEGYDVVYKGEVSWIDGAEAKTCEWAPDWKSKCEVDGTISGMTATVKIEGVANATVQFEVVDGILDMVSATIDGKTLSKAEIVAQGGSSDQMVRISEEQIPEMQKFITETCKL